MNHWLDRLMGRENWVAGAVRRGLEAYARESNGKSEAGESRPDGQPATREVETAVSIP